MSCRNCDCARCREANAPPPALVPFVRMACTCPVNGWWGVVPPPPCPVHGLSFTFTRTSTTTGAPND